MADDRKDSYHFYRISNIKDIPEGERLFFELDGNPVVLFNIDGNFLATGDLCSHDQGPIGDGEIIGEEIVCPRHGARFNMSTGEVTSYPAVTGIPVYPVRVVEEFVEVGIPSL